MVTSPDSCAGVSGPARRTVLAGVAWAVPVVVAASAAPLMAASVGCAAVTNDWSSPAVGSVFSSVTIGSTTMTLTTINAYPGVNNNKIFENEVGGITGEKLKFENKFGTPSGYTSSYTFTFSAPVSDLSMTIIDIDDEHIEDPITHVVSPATWRDSVYMTPGFTTVSTGLYITGTGTSTDPWISSNPNYNVPDSSAAGNVALTYPGTISSFTLYYKNSSSVTTATTQGIYLGPMTFTPSSC